MVTVKEVGFNLQDGGQCKFPSHSTVQQPTLETFGDNLAHFFAKVTTSVHESIWLPLHYIVVQATNDLS